MRTLYKIYLYSFPFANAFAPTETVNWTIILGMVLLVGAFFTPYNKVRLCAIDVAVALYLFAIVLSDVINIGLFDSKQLNHSMAWMVCFLLFFYVNRLYIRSVPIEQIYTIIERIFYVLVVFCIAEFVFSVGFGFDLNKIIPRPQGNEYEAGFWGFAQRARGFFSESGYAGMYIALTYPFVMYWQLMNGASTMRKVVTFLLTMCAAFAIFSTTFFIFFPFYFFFIFKIFSAKFYKFLLLISPLLIVSIIYFWQEIYLVVEVAILSKFEMGSATIREENLQENIIFVQNMPPLHMLFGYGPGSYYKLGLSDAASSVYVNIWRDTGLFGLCCYAGIWLAAIVRLWFNKTLQLSKYLLFMVAMVLTYHVPNMDYNFVSMWFVLAAIAEIDYFKLEKR